MSVYTTAEAVIGELPETLPDALTEDSYAKVVGWITDASAVVDTRLAAFYPDGFPDITDDPATPAMIEQIVRFMVAHRCLRFMGLANGDDQTVKELKTDAEEMLGLLLPPVNPITLRKEAATPTTIIAAYYAPAPYGQIVQLKSGENNESLELWFS